MQIQTKRKLARFLRLAEGLVDFLALCAMALFFIRLLPKEILYNSPATGGDMASHFWPLYTLKNHALPNWSLRIWNPGNLAGEPLLLFYFPLPFLSMALFSFVIPLATAFNIGTILPIILMPLAAYLFVRALRLPFPVPILAAAAVELFLFNESYSMWGGNISSNLAGQFAHTYALMFFLLTGAAVSWELRSRSWPIYSAILCSAVILSHSYLAMALPFFLYPLSFLHNESSLKRRIYFPTIAMFWGGMLSLWWIVPMLQSAPWTIAFFIRWESPTFWQEAVPRIFYGAFGAALLGIVTWIIFRTPRYAAYALRISLSMLPLIIFYFGMFFIMPALGLVDARAIPQIHLFGCILAGSFLGLVLFRLGPVIAWVLSTPLVILILWWASINTRNIPDWLRWNYTGWQTKPGYNDLMALSKYLKGTFSDPRVIYENADINNSAGTIRVFEMLPYFTGRATLESVYLQASIVAPAAFLLQAEISVTASCPFIQFSCVPHDVTKTEDRLRLLGVGELILTNEKTIKQAEAAPFLSNKRTFGVWNVFSVTSRPALVEVMKRAPLPQYDSFWETLPPLNQASPPPRHWKEDFYIWLRAYNKDLPLMLPSIQKSFPEITKSPGELEKCAPRLEVNFNQLRLSTNCVGTPHFIKFAYHPTWKADSGDEIAIVSPGYMALTPSQPEVTLTFGNSVVWKVADIISLVTLFITIILLCYKQLGTRK